MRGPSPPTVPRVACGGLGESRGRRLAHPRVFSTQPFEATSGADLPRRWRVAMVTAVGVAVAVAVVVVQDGQWQVGRGAACHRDSRG